MKIHKLDNILIVPESMEENGIIFDVFKKIKPEDPEYEKFLAEYEREQVLIPHKDDE